MKNFKFFLGMCFTWISAIAILFCLFYSRRLYIDGLFASEYQCVSAALMISTLRTIMYLSLALFITSAVYSCYWKWRECEKSYEPDVLAGLITKMKKSRNMYIGLTVLTFLLSWLFLFSVGSAVERAYTEYMFTNTLNPFGAYFSSFSIKALLEKMKVLIYFHHVLALISYVFFLLVIYYLLKVKIYRISYKKLLIEKNE